MPRVVLTAVVLIVLLVGGSRSVAAQESLAAAKDLYAAANYEDALKMLRGLELTEPAEKLEGAQYQVFCLIALDRMPEAEKVVEEILAADPLYAPDTSEASPRVVQTFDSVRGKVAPALTKDLYTEGKAALERKERALAIQKFELLLKVIERSGETENTLLGELKLLATGYVDLARAMPAPKPAPPLNPVPAIGNSPVNGNGNGTHTNGVADGDGSRAGSAPANGAPAGATVLPAGFVAAVPLTERFPPYDPKFLGRGATFKGSIRLRISADGRVEQAEIVQPIHQFYDARLLDAAQLWRYRPATMKGVPVVSERTVIVQLKQETPNP
jgi:tetratricopeptide (TPR) repeat protein